MNPAAIPMPENLETAEREVAELKAICAALLDSADDLVRLVEVLVSADAA